MDERRAWVENQIADIADWVRPPKFRVEFGTRLVRGVAVPVSLKLWRNDDFRDRLQVPELWVCPEAVSSEAPGVLRYRIALNLLRLKRGWPMHPLLIVAAMLLPLFGAGGVVWIITRSGSAVLLSLFCADFALLGALAACSQLFGGRTEFEAAAITGEFHAAMVVVESEYWQIAKPYRFLRWLSPNPGPASALFRRLRREQKKLGLRASEPIDA